MYPVILEQVAVNPLIALMLPVYFLDNKFLLLKESIHRKRIIYNGLLPLLLTDL